MKITMKMTTTNRLVRLAARCASAGLAAGALPVLALPVGHGHGGHGGGHATHTTHTSTVHAPAPVHTPAPAPVHTPAPAPVHMPAPAPVHVPAPAPVHMPAPAPVHIARPEPLTSARVQAAGERVRHAPMPEVRPGYYGHPNAAATLRVQSKPVPPEFARLQPGHVAHPDQVSTVGGNGSPRVAFNRRSIGGGSGVDSVRRDDAYRLADNRPSRNPDVKPNPTPGQEWRTSATFQNRGPVILPRVAGEQKIQYVEHKPVEKLSPAQTYRIVVARHPQDLKAAAADPKLKDLATGPGYVSRHYGDRLKGTPATAPHEPVYRIQ